MFKKLHDVGVARCHSYGGKDVKKFRNDVLKKYSQISEVEFNTLFPDKVVVFVKLNTKVVLYKNAHDDPIFFDPSGHLDTLIPTVYALVKIPGLLRSVWTNEHVSGKIMAGADLFLQGMVCEESDDFLKDQIRSVRVPGNPIPFAVGKMALSKTQALACGWEGRGLILQHCYNDQLFKMGSCSKPNDGFADTTVISISLSTEENISREEDSIEKVVESLSAVNVDDVGLCMNENSVPPDVGNLTGGCSTSDADAEMDRIIWDCAIGGLQGTKAAELPIPLNSFYSGKMLALKPKDVVSFDLKKSRFKKLPRLMEDLQEQQLIELKNVRKEACIVSIDKNHPTVKDWRPSSQQGCSSQKQAKGVISITHLFKAPQSIAIDILKLESRNDIVDPESIDARLKDYINHLGDDPRFVAVDDCLVSNLFGKKERPEPGDKVPYNEIKERLYSKLQKWHCIEMVDENGCHSKLLNKGDVGYIELTACKKSGRVFTLITGMENFGYDPQILSDRLQKRMKTASFVADLPGKAVHGKQISMSGDWVNTKIRPEKHVLQVFFEEDGIPLKCLKVINKLKK